MLKCTIKNKQNPQTNKSLLFWLPLYWNVLLWRPIKGCCLELCKSKVLCSRLASRSSVVVEVSVEVAILWMPPLLKLVIISFLLDLLGLDYCKNLEHSVGFRINQIKFWVLSSTLWLCWGRWGMGDSQGTGLWVLNCINFWPELAGQCCQHVYYYSTLRISTVLLQKTRLWRGVFLVLNFASRGCTESNSWKCNVTFLAMILKPSRKAP